MLRHYKCNRRRLKAEGSTEAATGAFRCAGCGRAVRYLLWRKALGII